MKKWKYLFSLVGLLVGCSSETNYAPVAEIATIEHIPTNGVHRVIPGETLYSIAWRYGLDYRYLAERNHISPPYQIVAGQRIYLNNATLRYTLPAKKPITVLPSASIPERNTNFSLTAWHWPAHGVIINNYSSLNKGINIGGKLGEPVYAAASGVIVYSGNGLRSYGNLIIIKHNIHYLSAYAHNDQLIVKEGQQVRAGQQIAKMGKLDGTQQALLHFEIRYNGRPVNPLSYLSPKNG